MSQWGYIQEGAGLAAGIIASIAFLFYAWSTFKGPTRPNRASWGIWTFISCLLLYSEWNVGSNNTVYVPTVYAVGSAIITILAIWKGENGLDRHDKWTLVAAAFCLSLIIVWHKSELWFIHMLCLVTDLIGVVPTFRKIYYEPEKETKFGWTLFALSNIANVYAVDALEFEKFAYPVYMLVVNGLLTAMVWQKGVKKKVTEQRKEEHRPLTRV